MAQEEEEEEDGLVYTLEEALTSVGIGKFQYMAICYAGLGFIAEAAETMILSFIGPALRSQWTLSPTQESLMTTVVFVGMLIGAIFWGFISDTYGRRKGLLSVAIVTALSAALSAFSPNYSLLLAVRMMVGFGVGGRPVYGSWFFEFVPSQNRGMWAIICSGFWTIGTILEALVALRRYFTAIEKIYQQSRSKLDLNQRHSLLIEHTLLQSQCLIPSIEKSY